MSASAAKKVAPRTAKRTARAGASFAFAPTPNYGISAKNAEIVGRRFVELAADGEVTPAQVVEDARDPSSPLHGFFEWDDRKAADKFRLDQARYLIRSVSIEITYEDGARETTRAFHSVEANDGRGYAPMTRVFTDADLTAQVMHSALRELDGWTQRYGRYEALGDARALVEQAKLWLRRQTGK